MKRAKLAPGSLPPGSLPSTNWYEIPRCFVCDEPIKSHRLSTSLLAGRTQYSHSPLPTKIGGYIGDQFVVVVTAQDALCKHCMALINTMDRLEQELRDHQSTLLQHLKTKYRLDGNPDPQMNTLEATDGEDLEVLSEVNEDAWKPRKKQRKEVSKHHHCAVCNANFSNLCLFMAHLSQHKSLEKSKPQGSRILKPKTSLIHNFKNLKKVSAAKVFHSVSGLEEGLLFKCGCCSESFTRKDKLAEHMQVHTSYPNKTQSLPSKLGMQVVKPDIPISKQHEDCSESSVPSAALFNDLDLLSEPEVPNSSGMCLEEQRGRVCLLALLNNGACSDPSHREPAASVVVSVCDDPAGSSSQVEPTVTVTVSVANDLHMLGNPLACLPSNGTTGNSEMPFSTQIVLTEPIPPLRDEFSRKESSAQCRSNNVALVNDGNITLSMPDLNECSVNPNGSSSEHKLASITHAARAINSDLETLDLKELSCKESIIRSDSCPNSAINSHIEVEAPSVLASNDVLTGSCQETLPANSCSIISDEFSLCQNKLDSTKSQQALDKYTTEESAKDSVNNIAIVSVMSVQMNTVNLDTEHSPPSWCYSGAGVLSSNLKDCSSTLNESWFDDYKEDKKDICLDGADNTCISDVSDSRNVPHSTADL